MASTSQLDDHNTDEYLAYQSDAGYKMIPPLCNTFTLQFPDAEANRVFYLRFVYTSRMFVERMYILVKLVFAAIALLFLDWQPRTVVVITIWVLGLLCWLAISMQPAVYIRLRLPILIVWRVLEPLVIPFLAQHCMKFKAPTLSGPTAFPILLFTTSHAVSLLLMSYGAAVPFWLHMLTQLYHLPLILATTTHLVVTNLCRCCPARVQAMHSTLSMLSQYIQPFHTPMIRSMQDTWPVNGECPVCAAWPLVLFVQLGVGGVIPAMVVYNVEWAARIRFAAEVGSAFNMRGVLPHEMLSAHPTQVVLTAIQGGMGLVLLWLVLQLLME